MSKTLKINREADCIGKYTFIGATDLESVIIPSTVSSIAPDTFSDCARLRTVYCEFGKDSIPGAPWGAPAGCKIYYRVYYENPVQESNKSGVGGVDVSGVTASPNDVLAGKKFVDAAGNLITGNMQDVTASLTGNIVMIPPGHIAETQVLTVPEAAEPTVSGNVVTVNAGYQAVQKQITVGIALAAKTYTPGTSDQTIAAGQYLSGKQTIEGEPNLASANIRANKSLFGKAGTFTADATATAEDIAAGKTAGINGEMVTGTLEVGGGGIDFYECASYNALDSSWAGYKVIQDGDTGVWETSSELTSGLTASYLTPKIGEIYSADTTIYVKKMYDGSMIPIPQDGLVFYAPLQEDYVDMVSGGTAVVNGGAFVSHNGIRCLQLDGSEYVKWPNNSDLPSGDSPYTLIILAAPTSQGDWRTYLTCGSESSGADLSAKNGNLREWGGTYITAEKWHTLCLAYNGEGDGYAYLDGELNGDGSVSATIPATAFVCVGAEPFSGYKYKVQGYVACTAIYDRELTAAEILEIHNILMDGVTQ